MLIRIEHIYVLAKFMFCSASSSELYIIPNVIVRKMISSSDSPSILSLLGGVMVLFALLCLFFNTISSLMFEMLRVNPKNTISIGLTAEPTGLFSIK